ncbi:dihydrolipoamide acetyltransferase family protein [Oceanobacillus longus]|uniref:Dihydrolipoamide acetyltransferase component of pyruvate dehydrogenase complex n=1 Tax=Oceanobacillus longus TaxID=930120 RepID=A0ABV8GSI6_9BACI
MSREKITMPQLGESVTEGTISAWLIKVGDHVNKYDPIAEVMTDKVNAEVPSSFAGVIKELSADEGDTVAVGDLICYIEAEGAETKDTTAQEKEEVITENKEKNTPEEESMKKRYSPAVLRMAQENAIDLNDVTGSGRGGRITRKDLEKIISSGEMLNDSQVRPVTNTDIDQSASRKTNHTAGKDLQTGDIEIPVKGIRKVIAENMVKSKQEIPHAWMTVEVDVTNLVKYRSTVKDSFKTNEGYGLTYFAFFVKAVAQALKEYPQLNSMWAGNKIVQKRAINLSIAVAKENELFVPVIKNADEKTIKAIARDIHELATKARNGKLTSEDMQGGTFTVNNTGSFGSISSMGVINHPQAAILQVESIVKRPVIIDEMFAARDMVNLSLSLDHRILDGLVCGRFLSRLKEILENMNDNTINLY